MLLIFFMRVFLNFSVFLYASMDLRTQFNIWSNLLSFVRCYFFFLPSFLFFFPFIQLQFVWQRSCESKGKQLFKCIDVLMFASLNHHVCSKWMEGTPCTESDKWICIRECINTLNIELMCNAHLKHLSIPFSHASHIRSSFVGVCVWWCICSTKRHNILLWMTNLLKFTYTTFSNANRMCYIRLPFSTLAKRFPP